MIGEEEQHKSIQEKVFIYGLEEIGKKKLDKNKYKKNPKKIKINNCNIFI